MSVHIPYATLESALFKRGCVNGCCGWDVGMLWLAVPVSLQPASVCPWGSIACFLLLDGRGNGCGRAEGQVGEGGAHTCSSLPLHYMWLTYFSSEQQRRGESWEGYRAKSQAERSPLVSGAGSVIP